MMALVAAGTLNSSAAYLRTAVNGASSGTLSLPEQGYRCGWRGGGRCRVKKEKKNTEIIQKAARGTKMKAKGGSRREMVWYVSSASGADGGGHSHAEGQLGVRGERDLKGNLRHGASISCKVTTV